MPTIDVIGPGAAALVTVLGLAAATISALVASGDAGNHSRKVRQIVIAVGAFGIGVASALMQYGATKDGERKTAAATDELHQTKIELDQTKAEITKASITVDDLAALNALSPTARYRIRLSTDPSPSRPCATAKKIEKTFPGAIANGGVRVMKIKGSGEPYWLLFGHNLSLAAAEVYQRLAVAHSLSNGLAPIEVEPGPGDAVDCGSIN